MTGNDQLMTEGRLVFEEMPDAEHKLLKVYPQVQRQEIIGFGGAFTESAAFTFSQMSEADRDKVIELYFGKNGSSYSLCRTHIQSCDFSLGSYSYINDPDDRILATFSIERDKEYIIPMVLAALEKNPDISFLASPWSPPDFMKTNGEMCHGGSLKKEYYGMWADMMTRYVEEYRKLGIMVNRLTVQNEPKAVQTWDSCIYSSEEEKLFACQYLNAALKNKDLSDVRINVWDHNKERVFDRAASILSDEISKAAISGIAFHWYSGDHFEAVALTREEFPDKELIFTEGCVEYSRYKKSNSITYAEMYAHDMIGTLAAGANGYIDWNLLLNTDGGPNHVGNYCDAPIMYDSQKSEIHIHLTYYYIGHISRFVLPGARRMPVSRYTDKLEAVGFVNPDGQRVMIVLNRTDDDLPFHLMENLQISQTAIPSHSIMTLIWNS